MEEAIDDRILERIIEEAFGYGKMAARIEQVDSSEKARKFLDDCKRTMQLNYYRDIAMQRSLKVFGGF